jgi:hypothetical protein
MWVYLYNPQTKWQSTYWKSLTSPKKQTFHVNTSKGKLMLEVFDNRTLFFKSTFHRATLWTRQCYMDILRCLTEATHWKHLQCWWARKWVLHHNNAAEYWSYLVDEHLVRHNITCVSQPPYHPSPNYYFFWWLKRLLKGQWFASSDEVEGATTRALNEVTSNALYKCFKQWYYCWQRCITAEGRCCKGGV